MNTGEFKNPEPHHHELMHELKELEVEYAEKLQNLADKYGKELLMLHVIGFVTRHEKDDNPVCNNCEDRDDCQSCRPPISECLSTFGMSGDPSEIAIAFAKVIKMIGGSSTEEKAFAQYVALYLEAYQELIARSHAIKNLTTPSLN